MLNLNIFINTGEFWKKMMNYNWHLQYGWGYFYWCDPAHHGMDLVYTRIVPHGLCRFRVKFVQVEWYLWPEIHPVSEYLCSYEIWEVWDSVSVCVALTRNPRTGVTKDNGWLQESVQIHKCLCARRVCESEYKSYQVYNLGLKKGLDQKCHLSFPSPDAAWLHFSSTLCFVKFIKLSSGIVGPFFTFSYVKVCQCKTYLSYLIRSSF